MPSRVNLPGAEELFRATGAKPAPSDGRASGRIRHDEKITVYLSSDEVLALEQARLTLRKAGVIVDRGRIVRAAIATALVDLEDNGPHAAILSQLGEL
jgi:hypothetical protein